MVDYTDIIQEIENLPHHERYNCRPCGQEQTASSLEIQKECISCGVKTKLRGLGSIGTEIQDVIEAVLDWLKPDDEILLQVLDWRRRKKEYDDSPDRTDGIHKISNDYLKVMKAIKNLPHHKIYICRSCGQEQTISSLEIYNECISCGVKTKLRRFASRGTEIQDVIETTLDWLGTDDEILSRVFYWRSLTEYDEEYDDSWD